MRNSLNSLNLQQNSLNSVVLIFIVLDLDQTRVIEAARRRDNMPTVYIIYRKVAAIYMDTMIKDGSTDRGGEHTVVKTKK